MRGTTCVVPVLEKGEGWLTCGVSVTRMVRLPCAMATVEMRTSEPITITPECLVDDHLGGLVGIDLDLLDVGEKAHHAAGIIGGHCQLNVRGIGGGRHGAAQIAIDARWRCGRRW